MRSLPSLPSQQPTNLFPKQTPQSGMEPRHANMSPPPPPTSSLIVPRFCRGKGGEIQSCRGDDKCALRSDAKCAARIPGRIRRGQIRDTMTIQTPPICHTHKQALSVFHHIKTTRPHLDSAPRSRFISGSISFPLPVLKHFSTAAPPSLPQSNNKSTFISRAVSQVTCWSDGQFLFDIYADALTCLASTNVSERGKQGAFRVPRCLNEP